MKKFVTLLVLVGALLLGLCACSSPKDAEDTAVKGIEMQNGKILVTYDDGRTEYVEIKD